MISTGETAIRRALVQENPWWADPKWKPMETEFERSYLNPFCDIALNLNIKRSPILMGPRQVGKTVMMKQLIHRAVSGKKPDFRPNRVFFASLDTPVYSNTPLDRLIGLFEAETGCKPDAKRLVIFDEIQYLEDWERHLKVLTDRHRNTKFIASGSAAAALKRKSIESGAGRFTDFFLPALTFVEFLEFAKWPKAVSFRGGVPKVIDIAELNKAFMDYLNYGGYPEAVLNPEIRKGHRQHIGRDIIDKVLLRDLPSLYGIGKPQELNRLLSMIAWNTGREMSVETLSQDSGVSKPTLMRYLEYLEAAMLVKRIRRVDDSNTTYKRDRNFKIYLTSPSLRAALFGPVTEDEPDRLGHLVENALFAQFFHTSITEHIYYARWKSGRAFREVDMVLLDAQMKNPILALEIKWSERPTDHPEELSGLVEYCKKNPRIGEGVYVTTKTHMDPLTFEEVEIRCHPCAVSCILWARMALDPMMNINNLPGIPLPPA